MKPAAGLGLNQNGRVVTALFVTACAVPAPLGDNLISVGSRRWPNVIHTGELELNPPHGREIWIKLKRTVLRQLPP